MVLPFVCPVRGVLPVPDRERALLQLPRMERGDGARVSSGLGNYERIVELARLRAARCRTSDPISPSPCRWASSSRSASRFWSTASRGAGRTSFRSAFFLPVVLPAFLAATIWRWMYTPNFGLSTWFSAGSASARSISSTTPARCSIALIAVDVWVSAGFNMVILLAGLKNIPQRLYEAARLDGAGRCQQVRYITIPMLAPGAVLRHHLRLHLGPAGVRRAVAADRVVLHRAMADAGAPCCFPVMDMMGRGLRRASGSARPRPTGSS